MLAYLDGTYLPRHEARVPVDDRGFLFGDGIYEVTRAVRGRLIEFDRHLARLHAGAAALRLPLPEGIDATLRAVHERLLDADGLRDGEATVYLQITRGAAPRTHAFPAPATPITVYASAAPLTPPDALRALGAAAVTHPDLRWARCDLKTVNLLPNVLAKQAATEAGAFEAILVRPDDEGGSGGGLVTEGAQTSVFVVRDGAVRTHPLGPRILPGVTRAVVLELAASLGVPVREVPFDVGALRAADECFVASTTSDVMPVTIVDGRPIADGRPGPVTRALAAAIAERFGRDPEGAAGGGVPAPAAPVAASRAAAAAGAIDR